MKRIDEYLVSNNLYDPMQMQIETEIGKLHNDIIQSFDQDGCTS